MGASGNKKIVRHIFDEMAAAIRRPCWKAWPTTSASW